MGIIDNIKKFGLKDIFSKQKQRQFITAKKEDFTGIKLESDEVESYVEQFIYRQLICPDCKKEGRCLVCECPFEDIQRTRVAKCGMKDDEGNDSPKWGEMMPKKDWEEFKKISGLKIEYFLRYG